MPPEEGAKMRLVLEAKPVRYLLDSEAGGGEKRLRLQKNVLIKPRANRFASRFLDDIRQVLRRDTQLLGIPRNILVLNAVLFH